MCVCVLITHKRALPLLLLHYLFDQGGNVIASHPGSVSVCASDFVFFFFFFLLLGVGCSSISERWCASPSAPFFFTRNLLELQEDVGRPCWWNAFQMGSTRAHQPTFSSCPCPSPLSVGNQIDDGHVNSWTQDSPFSPLLERWFCWRLSCVVLLSCCVVVWFLVEHTQNVGISRLLFGVYSISSVHLENGEREKTADDDSHRQRMSSWRNWPHLIWDSHM